MRLIPIEMNDIPKINSYKPTKNFGILDEFSKSDAVAVRIDADYGCKASLQASAINNSAKRFGFAGIKAIARRPYVYLIREV